MTLSKSACLISLAVLLAHLGALSLFSISCAQWISANNLAEPMRLYLFLAALAVFAGGAIIYCLFDKYVVHRLNYLSAREWGSEVRGLAWEVSDMEIARLSQRMVAFNERINELSERENAIADHSLDLICSIFPSKVICAINAAGLRQFGFEPAALVGHSLENFLSAEDLRKLSTALNDAKSSGYGSQAELRIRTQSGELKDFSWSFEWSGSNGVFFCTARDITSQKQLDRVKHEFIAMVSHDLRSPLMSIRVTLELLMSLAQDKLPERLRSQVIGAETSVNSLIALINDLLDIEQMDAGKLQIKVSETMVQDLFERTTWALESFAFQHGVKLAFQATELEFSFDAARIEQVLINLISNAIKFSSSGTVINLEAHEDGDAVEILVIDQGRGIPEEERPFIFDRFRQVEALDAKRGSGLGLAICKLIVESHSGAIGVRTPSSGKGSEFWLRLPYVKEA